MVCYNIKNNFMYLKNLCCNVVKKMKNFSKY